MSVAAIGAVDYAQALDGLSLKQAQLMLTTQGIVGEEQRQMLIRQGLIATSDNISAKLTYQALQTTALTKAEQQEMLIEMGLMDKKSKQLLLTNSCTEAELRAQLTKRGYIGTQQDEIVTAILGTGVREKEAISWKVLTTSILESAKAMLVWLATNPVGQMIIAAGVIAGVAGAYDLLTMSVEEAQESLEEFNQACSDLDSATTELQSIDENIKSIQDKGTLSLTDQADLSRLEQEKSLLEKEIQLLERKKELTSEKSNSDAVKAVNDGTYKNGDGFFSRSVDDLTRAIMQGELDSSSSQEYLRERGKKTINDAKIELAEIQRRNMELLGQITGTDEDSQNAKKQLQEYIDYVNKYLYTAEELQKMKFDGFLSENENIKNAFNDLSKNGADVTSDSIEKLANKFPALKTYMDENGISAETLAAEFAKTSGEAETTGENVNKMTDSLEGVTKTLSTLQGKYNELKSAQDEYNSTGAISAETMQKLIDNDLLKYLDFSSGKLKINTQALINEGEAAKVSAIQNLQNAAAHDLMVLAGTKTGEMSNTAKTAIENMGNAAETTGNQAETAAGKLLNFAAGAWAAAGLDPDTQSEDFMAKANAIISAYKNIANTIGGLTIRTPKGGGSSSSKDKPDYEDPTDAIIDRINLRHRELEQQEEYIENAREIAELENDYKKQISLTNDKLDIQRQKVDALKTANSELHQMAEDLRNSTPDWNEEEWFDSQGNATKAYNTLYNNSSKEDQEKIKDQFEKISKIKKAWVANDEERLELTKKILQTEEDIVNLDFGHSQDWIDERNTYNDWALFNDSEIDAWERVIKRLKEDYKDCAGAAEKLKEAEENLFETRKEQFDKSTDLGSSYYDSQKTLLQSYYDVTNSIAEAQHEINKELEASKTMYEWLDEDTRKLLFNQEDYNILSEELYDIQYKADKLRRQYERDLENSTLNTIEEITSNYEMQYDMLMKSYEIAKADLEVAKKKQKLNNVLNERNVRMFINGQWQWVADTQNVIDAQSELADAEYARKTAIAGERQTESLNDLTKQQDELGTVINKFEDGVITLDEAMDDVADTFGRLPDYVEDAFAKIQGASSKSSSSKTSYSKNINSDYVSWAKSQMAINSAKWHTASDTEKKALENANQSLGSAIGSTYDSATGTWKHKYGSGTKNTLPGKALLGENGDEMFIDNKGHLIPINQLTIADIGAGGTVFNQFQMKNLKDWWDLSNIAKPYYKFVGERKTQQVVSHDNRIIINGMTVDSGSSDGQALINAIRRYVGNH